MSKLSTDGLRRIQSALGIGLLVAPLVAVAQTTPSGSVQPGRTDTFEEIIVTAQKREQSIKDVPMSITAVTGAELSDRGIVDVGGLSKIDTSFVESRASYGTPVYSIRGIGYNEQSLAASPTVSVYTDQVPYAYPALTKGADLDVERVEILKGPQGTLYGQNATGGAVNFIAAKPTDSLQGAVNLGFGRFDARHIDAFVGGPLTDSLRGRVALSVDEGGAWQQSYTRDASLGNARTQKIRALLDWKPSQDFKVELNLNAWHDQSDTQAGQLIGIDLLTPALGPQVPLVSTYPLAPPNNRSADWDPSPPPRNDEKFYQAALRIEYTPFEAFSLTSLTSYQHYTQNNYIDNDGTALANNSELQTGSVQSLYEELRASGVAAAEKLHWLFGVQWSDDRTEELVRGYLPYSTSAYPFTAIGLPPFTNIAFSSNPDVRTKGVFGNVDYAVLDNVTLHAGARYTKSDIKYNGCLIATDPNFGAGLTLIETAVKQGIGVIPINQGDCTTFDANFNPGLQHLQLHESNVPWHVGLDWKPDPGTLVYVSATKGFKAGGFPTLPATGAVQLAPVTQESVLSYELGLKTDFGNRAFELDSAIFHYDYKNKQLRGRILDPTGVFGVIDALVNVPTSKEDGAELSLLWRPIAGLTLSAAATYLDSRVTGTFETLDPYTGTKVGFSGYSFPNTPRWTLAAGSSYEWSVGGSWLATVGANYHYQTDSQSAFVAVSDVANGYPSQKIDSYGLLDLVAGVHSDKWKLQVYGNNVTDKYYWQQTIRVYDTTVRYTGLPATFGVRVGYRF
jgi:outer membrane receptor protein involved in Fe transport